MEVGPIPSPIVIETGLQAVEVAEHMRKLIKAIKRYMDEEDDIREFKRVRVLSRKSIMSPAAHEPTYFKVHMEHLAPDTLQHYSIPFEIDQVGPD